MAATKLALTALLAGAALAAPALVTPSAEAAPKAAANACPAPPPLTFAAPTYVDKNRAGGEPLVFTYPNGRLLYSAHAGTTHFFAPEAPNSGSLAFGQNYTGQTYIWTSDDNGKTWTFRPRVVAPSGAPASGFSDPEFAMDSAGGLYFSEINLANVAVSSSREDHGTTWSLENFTGAVLTDRQWMEADRKGELYFVANGQPGGTGIPPGVQSGHYISKSTDGGKTFSASVPDTKGGSGLGDIRVDKRTGTVYEAHYDGNKLSLAAFRKARTGDLTATDTDVIAENVKMLAHWPAFDLDPSGNIYVTWDESGKGDREAGVYYSRSTDGGRTWATPVRVDTDDKTDIWPWIGVGDDGRVGIAWLEADKKLPNQDAQTSGTYGWRIVGAVTTTGLGCATSTTPSFSVAVATKDPVHTGTICQGGTVCQAQLIDRRLGDYFSVEVDGTGRMWAGYADTRVPGSVSLPAFVRQQGGPSLLVPKGSRGTIPTATTGRPAAPVPAAVTPQAGGNGSLASTGASAQLPASGALMLIGAMLLLRRRFAGRPQR